jgi:hypothetical protein
VICFEIWVSAIGAIYTRYVTVRCTFNFFVQDFLQILRGDAASFQDLCFLFGFIRCKTPITFVEKRHPQNKKVQSTENICRKRYPQVTKGAEHRNIH